MFNKKITLFVVLMITALFILVIMKKPSEVDFDLAEEHLALSTQQQNQIITPIPNEYHVDKEKALLGKKLFHDPILSANNSISCAFCHDLANGGDDARKVALGINGHFGTVNSPTVLNAKFNFRQFWDGRSKNLKEQAFFPVQNDIEMGSEWPNVIERLKKHNDYPQLFSQAYEGQEASIDLVTDAIAEFEKTLITPNSRFDKYIQGDKKALSDYEIEGYNLFKDMGCINCHQGQNIGGNMFQKLGHFGNYFEGRTDLAQTDFGLFNVTKREEDKFKFKVPSLRNIEKTAPYFHDGKVETLEKAVELMAYYQLGREISETKRNKIVAFLKTLTGELKTIEK